MKKQKAIKKKSITVGTIVLISGVISVVVGVEFLWGALKFFGWADENFLNWSQLLIMVPFMTIAFSLIPVLIISFLSGIFSYYY